MHTGEKPAAHLNDNENVKLKKSFSLMKIILWQNKYLC